MIAQQLDSVDHGGALLANQCVNAEYVFSSLVDDGINAQAAPTQAFVANDELALALANWNQCINDFDACVQGSLDEIAGDDGWGSAF